MALADLLSVIFRHASSFKNEAFRRLLSFNSSDRDANLEDAQPPEPQPSPTHETIIPIPPLEIPLEIEPVSLLPSSTTTTDTSQEDFRKGVQTAAPLVSTISFGLIMNPLPSNLPHLFIIIHNTCAYLSLFLGVGLLMHSIFTPACPEAERSQKKVIIIMFVLLFLGVVLHASLGLTMVTNRQSTLQAAPSPVQN